MLSPSSRRTGSSNRPQPRRTVVATVLALIGVSAVAIALLLVWRRSNASDSPPLQPALPQDSAIQAYFNHAESSRYSHPYRGQQRPGDNLEQVIIDAIAAAQSSVDMAIQEVNLPLIARALADRQRAGVRVRVILENQYHRPWSALSATQVAALSQRDRRKYGEFLLLADANGDGDTSPQEMRQHDALTILAAAGIPIIDDTADGSRGSGLMHHKFLVVDGQTVVTGSANFTLSGLHGDMDSETSLGNANHLLQLTSLDLAQRFTQEFNLMWGDGPGGKADSRFGLQKPYRPAETLRIGSTRIDIQFSPASPTRPWPDSANGLVGRWLLRANRSIDLALFVFSDQQISAVLQTPHRAGVPIRALIEPSFAYRPYSEALDMLGIALVNAQCRYDAGNSPWLPSLSTVGVPSLPEGDVLHHKFAVVDDQQVLTGSQNWSEAANYTNDEVLLAIANPTVTAHFQREFDRLYDRASIGVPTWLSERIDQRRDQCF